MTSARRAATSAARATTGTHPSRSPALGPWILGVLAFALLVVAGVPRARATTEEFSTFSISAMEEDDESLIDLYLLRTPRIWRDEWEHAAQAIRTSQGCVTSGEWFMDTDLKLRSPVGRSANFGLDLRQYESLEAASDNLDFSIHVPTRWGTPGALFRPYFDKSRQDFAFMWDVGADTTALQLEAAFTIEDMFNNLWAWRQTRVGNAAEPYERHPYEPALMFVTRHEHLRFEVSGKYLTPSKKLVLPYAPGLPQRETTLWGALGHASLEARADGIEAELRFDDKQATSTDQPIDHSAANSRDFRRWWSAETALRGAPLTWLSLEGRYLYSYRDQHWGPPYGPSDFWSVDRVVNLEADVALHPRFTARFGGLYDRVTVTTVGTVPFTYGTRNESRGYVGLIARFGRVSVSGIEGIELDPEPYDVWFVHDKGFLHLQTTF